MSEGAGKWLRNRLECTNTLEILDLSWNKFRMKSCIEIAKGLHCNRFLKKLNLAWNGFDDESVMIIGESLCVNNILVELDLSNDRVSTRGLKGIASGLLINKTLAILQAILLSCLTNEKTNLHAIYLEGSCVSEQNRATIKKLESMKPQFAVPVGGYTKTIDTVDQHIIGNELICILEKYVMKNKLRVVYLFNQWDKDKKCIIIRQAFRKAIKACQLSFTNNQIDILTT